MTGSMCEPCCDDDDELLLLCGEDAGDLERDGDAGRTWAADTAGLCEQQLVPEEYYYPDLSTACDAACCSPAAGSPGGLRKSSDDRPAGWAESVSWILKARSCLGFQPATAFLAVSYMDRFLTARTLPVSGPHPLKGHGWAIQLLSVACLSLAAKMEETSVPPLLDLQTVQRMELLVLAELDWRLRSLTPFAFIDLFACKADSSGRRTRSLVLRACQITLNSIHETEFLNHCPASAAAAAVLCAAAEIPGMSCISTETAAAWCTGLTEEGIRSCYQLLQQLAPTTKSTILASELLRSTPSSVSLASPSKRLKINGCFGEE